jgi:DNA/RNA-binding domain of Phe-tRNA-synthetase-like protein
MSHEVEVDPRIWDLRPDFVVSVVRARQLENGPSDSSSTSLFRRAEERAREALKGAEPAAQPHVAAWREAYRAFGARAQRTPSSAEALVRRVVSGEGLPPINRLVDLYNALSVEFLIPVGGEDLSRIVGPSRLTIAAGAEPFDTLRSGEPIVEQPAAGEVVWLDDAGVTCRRWNWRQAHRTQLRDDTTTALFILDALDPMTDEALHAAADDLVSHLARLGPDVQVVRRLIASATMPFEGD